MEIPPTNSRTNEFTLIKAYIAPIYINFIIKEDEEKSIENKINKTIDTIIWINKRENKFLNHALKNQLVEFNDKDNSAKGESKAKTFTITYRKEYENTRLSKENVKVDFIRPSTEKIFVVVESIPIVEFISLIKEEKQISTLNIFSPKFRIDKVIFEQISKICFTIK